jgi:uncharacterized protein YecT (DUF1311 family)
MLAKVHRKIIGWNHMGDLVKTIGQTPLPTIFVLAGIACWILAIAGSIAGQISIEPSKRQTAQVAGTVFIGLGLMLLYFAPPGGQSEVEATPAPGRSTSSPANPAAKTVSDAWTTREITAAPAAPSPVPSNPTAFSHAKPSPGVNCNGTPDELAICSNAQLRDLDWRLHDLYAEKLKGIDQDQQAQLAREESRWVKQRNSCASSVDCLVTAYRLRMTQLGQLR